MNVRLISFYTPGAYELHAQQLQESAKAVGLEVHARKIEGLSGWHHAVCSKPIFILQELSSCTEDGILWVDADARFRVRPDTSILEGIDFASCLFQRNKNTPVEMLTGTLYFRNTPEVLHFVERWCINTRKWKQASQDTPEQHSLRETFQAYKDKVRFLDLPKEWVYIEPDFEKLYPDVTPIISHLQASRTLRV